MRNESADIVAGKIAQVPGLLEEFDLDAWLVFVRETPMMADPVLPVVVGIDVSWQSFFLYTRSGDAVALVGNLDQEDFKRSGRFTAVHAYTEGPGDLFRQIISAADPRSIGVNFATDDPSSDGLTHGMYLLLQQYLDGTPYGQRLVSARDICTRLRSRKTRRETERLEAAAALTVAAWDAAVAELEPGMTEREIAAVIDEHIVKRGGDLAFPTIVNAGSKTSPGHGRPTEACLEPGDLLHVDFGARVDGYCADLQRLAYFRRDGEADAPGKLVDAFNLVARIIVEAARRLKPGLEGWELDALAREMLRDAGYPEYQHALGHQLGRSVHDGGAILGPKWPRYGKTIEIPLERDSVFTLELEIILDGIGCVGLEEDVIINDNGATFLSRRQQELIIK